MNSSLLGNAENGAIRPNIITPTHAEGDAFNQMAGSGIRSERATLWVDNPDGLCSYCNRSDGVKWLAQRLGVKELTVVTPTGKQVITIDPSINSSLQEMTPPGALLAQFLNQFNGPQ